MRSIPIAGAFVLCVHLLAACSDGADPTAGPTAPPPSFAQVPADGNGNKEVMLVDVQLVDFATCEGGATLDVHLGGWVQIREVSQVPVAILPVHLLFTYSNATGGTFVWHEIGIDQFLVDENGELIHVIIGRAGGFGVIGRLVINTVTDEVEFVAGTEVFANDLACDALT